MNTLDLSLDSSVSLQTATPAMALTPFGKIARYLFIVGIERYAKQMGDNDGANDVRRYTKQAFDVIDQSVLKTLYRIPRSRAASTPISVVPTEEQLAYLRTWYRDVIKEDVEISVEEKDLFRRAMAFITAGKDSTPSSLKSNERVAWQVSTYLGQLYNDIVRLKKDETDVVDKITTLTESAKRLTKQLTGSSTLKVDAKVSERAKLDPRVAIDLTAYRGVVKKLKDHFDAIVKRDASSGPIPVSTLEKTLTNMGFEMMFFPTEKTGFRGMIGIVAGKVTLFTSFGKQLAMNIPPDAKVVMNKKYNPELDDTYYLQYTAPNAVTTTSIYTAEYKGRANETKFEDVEANTQHVSKWVKAWKRDIASKDPMKRVPATVAYLLYMTGARVGSSTESLSKLGKERTYGISTLRVEHVKVTSASIILDYNGKKGVQQRHVLKISDDPGYKLCAKTLLELKEGKKKDALLFEFPRPASRAGTLQAVNPSFFKSYLKSIGFVGKVHALRHIRGTALVRELLATEKFNPTGKNLAARQKAADDYIKNKILTKAGELLGHKSTSKGVAVTAWRTSIQSYVNPRVVADWYTANKLVVPKWVPKTLEKD